MRHHLHRLFLLTALLLFSSEIFAQLFVPKKAAINNVLSNAGITCLTQDQGGRIWIGTNNGLNCYDGFKVDIYKKQLDQKQSILSNSISKLFVDSYGHIWIGFKEQGVSRFTNGHALFKNFNDTESPTVSIGNTIVQCFFEDSKRQLWIGTNKGLFYYNSAKDQLTFVALSKHQQHIPVMTIAEDEYQQLWVGSASKTHRSGYGLFRMNITDKNARALSLAGLSRPLGKHSNQITKIIKGANNDLWIGTFRGGTIHLKDPKKSNINHSCAELFFNTKNKDEIVYTMMLSKRGAVWVGTNQGLVKYTSQDQQQYSAQVIYNDPVNKDPFGNIDIHFLGEDHQGNIWAASPNGSTNLLKIEPEHSPKTPALSTIALQDNSISCLFIDKTNILWLGHPISGLSKLDLQHKKFHVYQSQAYPSNQIAGNKIYGLEETAHHNIWIGTSRGLSSFNPITGKFQNFINEHENQQLNQNSIFCLKRNTDDNDHLWIGYFRAQISDFNISNYKNRPINYENTNKEFDGWSVTTLADIGQEELWIGTIGSGLWHKKNNKFRNIKFKNHDGIKSSEYNIMSLYLDDSLLWLGTQRSGIRILNLNDQSDRHFAQRDSAGLSDNFIKYIFKASDGIYWIGTHHGGLNRFDYQRREWKTYSVKDGICDNTINGILEDDDKNLWLSTNNGISKFDPISETFINYGIGDGLPSREFNPCACLKASDGRMYFGSMAGLVAFYPQEIKGNPYAASPFLTGIEINNKRVFAGDTVNGDVIFNQNLDKIKTIPLNHNNNSIKIEFSAAHYSFSKNLKFAYKLENFDHEWVTPNENNHAVYTNLDQGTYQFRLKSANPDSIWSDQELTFSLVVTPPWYKSLIFKILTFIALILFGVIFIRIRTSQLYQAKIKLKKLVEERTQELHRTNQELIEKHEEISLKNEQINIQTEQRTQFFMNISHEFRTPITLLLGPIEKIRSNNELLRLFPHLDNYLRMMHKNALRLLNLVDELLEVRKLELGKKVLTISYDEINSFVKKVAIMFEDAIQSKQIALSVTTENEQFTYFDSEAVDRILVNLISNALKYTDEHGKIEVSCEVVDQSFIRENYKSAENYVTEQYVQIAVSDNGCGISPEKLDHIFEIFYQHTQSKKVYSSGLGLALVKNLINVHQGYIDVLSSPQGSTFRFAIPLVQQEPEKVYPHFNMGAEATPSYSSINKVQEVIDDSDKKRLTTPAQTALIQSVTDTRKTLLMIDDNDDILEYLKGELYTDYQIITAENGAVGFEKCLSNVPDIVLCDIMMPICDGYQFCEKMKDDSRTQHIPVILLTAKQAPESQIHGLDSGASAYLKKPINISLLKSQLNNLLMFDQGSNNTIKQIVAIADHQNIALSGSDKSFIQNAVSVVENHISDPNFKNQTLCDELLMGKTQLYRKIKDTLNMTVSEFVKEVKLQKAVNLIMETDENVSSISYMVGYNIPGNFTRDFKKKFGVTPTNYKKKIDEEAPVFQ